MTDLFDIEMFYDGDCPLCMRETRLLGRLDQQNRIRFTNIAAPDFVAADYGKSHDEFMAEMHGRLIDGTWVSGGEVFRRLYSAVGLRPIVWLTRLPIISHLFDLSYAVFARHRLRLTGRCRDQCEVVPHSAK
ncbi:MAG: DUF393 domain-containing protein [Fuerstiella sp.]|nr:DUF393 domain-containing protein [Fuerstiella sp.]